MDALSASKAALHTAKGSVANPSAAPAEGACTVLQTVASVLQLSALRSPDLGDETKQFEQCWSVLQQCLTKDADNKAGALAAAATLLSGSPAQLFLKLVEEAGPRLASMLRDEQDTACHAATCACVSTVIRRLGHCLAAPGVRATVAPALSKLLSAALGLLDEGKPTAQQQRGCQLIEDVLHCMPQVVKSQTKTVGAGAARLLCSSDAPLASRALAARTLGALPLALGTSETWSLYLHGLLTALHSSLDQLPMPRKDSDLSTAAREVLTGTSAPPWDALPVAEHAKLLPKVQLTTLLLESLDRMLCNPAPFAVRLPVSALLLLVSRLVSVRPLRTTSSITAPIDSCVWQLCSGPLLSAGLLLLQRLLHWPELLLQAGTALCELLADLLSDAAQRPPQLPPEVRSTVYRVAAITLQAFGVAATEALFVPLMRTAWAEFFAAEDTPPNGAPPSAKRRRVKSTPAKQGTEIGGVDASLRAVEYSHRPSALSAVAEAQEQVVHCLTALYNTSVAGMSESQQLELDVFTCCLSGFCGAADTVLRQQPVARGQLCLLAVRRAALDCLAAAASSAVHRPMPLGSGAVQLLRHEAGCAHEPPAVLMALGTLLGSPHCRQDDGSHNDHSSLEASLSSRMRSVLQVTPQVWHSMVSLDGHASLAPQLASPAPGASSLADTGAPAAAAVEPTAALMIEPTARPQPVAHISAAPPLRTPQANAAPGTAAEQLSTSLGNTGTPGGQDRSAHLLPPPLLTAVAAEPAGSSMQGHASTAEASMIDPGTAPRTSIAQGSKVFAMAQGNVTDSDGSLPEIDSGSDIE